MNNIDVLATVKRSAWKPWILEFVWMPRWHWHWFLQQDSVCYHRLTWPQNSIQKVQSMEAPSWIKLDSNLLRHRRMTSGEWGRCTRGVSHQCVGDRSLESCGFTRWGLHRLDLLWHVLWIWRPGQPLELFITAYVTAFLSSFSGVVGHIVWHSITAIMECCLGVYFPLENCTGVRWWILFTALEPEQVEQLHD